MNSMLRRNYCLIFDKNPGFSSSTDEKLPELILYKYKFNQDYS